MPDVFTNVTGPNARCAKVLARVNTNLWSRTLRRR